MRINNRLWLLALCALAVTPCARAVDLVGVLDLAEKNDPRLRAAEYRREAVGENKRQAWANLLPSIGATGAWTALVTGVLGVAEVHTTGALHDVAADCSHVTQLRACARQKRLA